MTNTTNKFEALIKDAYDGFNSRNADAVLSLMQEDVEWPNGWEGGYVHGQEAVKEYWLRQWKDINPTVEPVAIAERENGQVEVSVHQTVKDHAGQTLFDGLVKHVYTFRNGKIQKMDIETV